MCCPSPAGGCGGCSSATIRRIFELVPASDPSMSAARRSLSGTLRLDRLATSALLVLLCGLAHPAPEGAAARFYEDALARYERQDLAGAIVQLKNALQIDKNMLPVQVLLGKALLQNGEAIPAEVALTEALRLGVSRAEVVLPLMQAHLAQGK